MKSDVNQSVSLVAGVKVGRFKSDGSRISDVSQGLGYLEPLIGNRQVKAGHRPQMIAASEKVQRGGTTKFRGPYTPCWGSLTDLREFFSNLIQGAVKLLFQNRVGGLGVWVQ